VFQRPDSGLCRPEELQLHYFFGDRLGDKLAATPRTDEGIHLFDQALGHVDVHPHRLNSA